MLQMLAHCAYDDIVPPRTRVLVKGQHLSTPLMLGLSTFKDGPKVAKFLVW